MAEQAVPDPRQTAEAADAADQATMLRAPHNDATGLKPCPKCAFPIQKSGGCLHMACGKCAAKFCWRCGGYDARAPGSRYTCGYSSCQRGIVRWWEGGSGIIGRLGLTPPFSSDGPTNHRFAAATQRQRLRMCLVLLGALLLPLMLLLPPLTVRHSPCRLSSLECRELYPMPM